MADQFQVVNQINAVRAQTEIREKKILPGALVKFVGGRGATIVGRVKSVNMKTVTVTPE